MNTKIKEEREEYQRRMDKEFEELKVKYKFKDDSNIRSINEVESVDNSKEEEGKGKEEHNEEYVEKTLKSDENNVEEGENEKEERSDDRELSLENNKESVDDNETANNYNDNNKEDTYLYLDDDKEDENYKDFLIGILTQQTPQNQNNNSNVSTQSLGDQDKNLKISDFDYDEQKYEEYIRNKLSFEYSRNEVQNNLNKKIDKYLENGKQIGQKFEIGRKLVETAFNDVQLSALIQKTKDPSKVVSILGRNPSLIKELKGIEDVIDFSIRINEIERSIRQKRISKPKTQPEKRVRGASTGGNQINSKKLDHLAEMAINSGDGTELYNVMHRR